MTADKSAADDAPDDCRDDPTGKWEWVPAHSVLASTSLQSSGPRDARDIPNVGPVTHSRVLDAQRAVHWVCAFGHPAVQSPNHVSHLTTGEPSQDSAKSSGGEDVDRATRSRSHPRPDTTTSLRHKTSEPDRKEPSTHTISRSPRGPVETPAPHSMASKTAQSIDRVVADPALLAALLASITVSSPRDTSNDSLPSTLSSQPGPSPPSAVTTPSVETLLFYHHDPVVPIPAGMAPLPPLPTTERPIGPETSVSQVQPARHYISFVSTLPGLDFMPWNEWRPRIESHRGFPKPYRPDFRAPENREQARKWWSDKLSDSNRRESPVRVLPPPPRPEVVVEGPHWWVVYVGRTPGIYTTADDVIIQTRGFPNAQAEIFSDEDTARRWYWYARAQGFLVPRFGGLV